MTYRNAKQLAAIFGCSPRKIRETATALGIGLALGGRAGYRYSEADLEAIKAALTPAPPVERRRRRSA
jgi:hypothetical protein